MMPRLLILIILLATLLGGCARNRHQPPKRADAVLPAAAGKRVVINDENGQPTLKIRARKNAWKVYDENFRAAGFVRWTTNTAPHVENLVREKLARFQSVGNTGEVFELAGHLRIEKIDAGWAVFDQNAQLLGLFEYTSAPNTADATTELPAVASADSQDAAEQPSEKASSPALPVRWTLRTAYNTPVLWTSEHKGKQIIARHKDGKIITGSAAHFSAPALLAGELESLSALQRAALAAWFIHMMPAA